MRKRILLLMGLGIAVTMQAYVSLWNSSQWEDNFKDMGFVERKRSNLPIFFELAIKIEGAYQYNTINNVADPDPDYFLSQRKLTLAGVRDIYGEALKQMSLFQADDYLKLLLHLLEKDFERIKKKLMSGNLESAVQDFLNQAYRYNREKLSQDHLKLLRALIEKFKNLGGELLKELNKNSGENRQFIMLVKDKMVEIY